MPELMRRFFLSAALLAFLLASCEAAGSGPGLMPAPVTRAVTAPPPAVPAPAREIRFALIGQPTEVNAWALFDETGASYANYALRADDYPRLYRLSVPAREFEPYIAVGMPSAVTQEGTLYVATVKVHSGLTWSDGSPLTANDVAFTVNVALGFHLGLDWLSAYNPSILDHAEALDDETVKFFFKAPFTVAAWQYGALQGPILSKAFWEPKLTEAEGLLPPATLAASIAQTQADANTLQGRIDGMNADLQKMLPTSKEYNDLALQINKIQKDLNSQQTKLGKLQGEYDAALSSARSALFALTDKGEPTFGPFLRGEQNRNVITRQADPTYPFTPPNFKRAAYTLFPDEASAVAALQSNEVDSILSPDGISIAAVRQIQNGSVAIKANLNRSMRFLVFNAANSFLANSALRQSLACLLDNNALGSSVLLDQGGFSHSFVPQGETPWYQEDHSRPCEDLQTADARLQKSIQLLKAAGYSWDVEPRMGAAGQGFRTPDGAIFPSTTLIAPQADPLRVELADLIQQALRPIGIPMVVKLVDVQEINFVVFSSGMYDMAILGWRLSDYPGYLCEWFQPPSPFAYNGDRLKSACEAMKSTADLGTARQSAFQAQSALMEGLPFIPLYEGLTYDVYRNIQYPFENVLDGISSLYGAPSLAVPSR